MSHIPRRKRLANEVLMDDYIGNRREGESGNVLYSLEPLGMAELDEVKGMPRMAPKGGPQFGELAPQLGNSRIRHDDRRHYKVTI